MIREELLALADEIDADAESIAGYLDSCEGNFSKSDADEYYKFAGWANRIREAVERDGECATTVSAYDLLPEEDREAIAWVREHGGLEAVEKRLMPEGMEWLLDVWPKWSNGEYCKFGDWWKAEKYSEREPRQLSRLAFFTPEQLREWGQDEGENFGYEWDFMRPSDTTYRPDKAEPPALDADGNRIEPAMDVWWICEGDELGIHAEKLHVESIGEDGFVECSPFNGGTWVELDSTELYVHKPVPDADGEPIREGDTVYVLGFGEPLTVKGFADDGRVLMSFHGENSLGYKPSKLTHEQPDTWERLEEDAGKNPFDYCKDVGHRLDTCENSEAYKARDLVRRCRALVEKEDRNE